MPFPPLENLRRCLSLAGRYTGSRETRRQTWPAPARRGAPLTSMASLFSPKFCGCQWRAIARRERRASLDALCARRLRRSTTIDSRKTSAGHASMRSTAWRVKERSAAAAGETVWRRCGSQNWQLAVGKLSPQCLRAGETIGRPLGSGPSLLDRVAKLVGRDPRPAERGPKRNGWMGSSKLGGVTVTPTTRDRRRLEPHCGRHSRPPLRLGELSRRHLGGRDVAGLGRANANVGRRRARRQAEPQVGPARRLATRRDLRGT